jgi:hypothetical protein
MEFEGKYVDNLLEEFDSQAEKYLDVFDTKEDRLEFRCGWVGNNCLYDKSLKYILYIKQNYGIYSLQVVCQKCFSEDEFKLSIIGRQCKYCYLTEETAYKLVVGDEKRGLKQRMIGSLEFLKLTEEEFLSIAKEAYNEYVIREIIE